LPYVALVIPFVIEFVQEHVPVGGMIESTWALMPAGMPLTLRKKIGSVFTVVGEEAPVVMTAARTYVYAPESGIDRCVTYDDVGGSMSVTVGVAPALEVIQRTCCVAPIPAEMLRLTLALDWLEGTYTG
jgi:hypothetical protein